MISIRFPCSSIVSFILCLNAGSSTFNTFNEKKPSFELLRVAFGERFFGDELVFLAGL
jgi:hypothetical protein